MKPSAIRATYSDWKLVRTRQVIQLVFEVPLAEADAAYEVIGGMPNPANERWFAIAALDLTQKHVEAKPNKRDWRDLPPAQQAGIRCEEAAFVHFLKEQRPDDWNETQDTADCVRLICGVTSRSELGTKHASRIIWKQLDDAYSAWRLAQ